MAKKFVRGITDVKTINNQDFDTNNVNDLLSDGQYNYIHRKKGKTEEYHNLTDNIKTISSDNTDLLTVTNNNKTTNTALLSPKHDAQKEQVLESTRNTISIHHGTNGTAEKTTVDTNPQKVLEHENLQTDYGISKTTSGNTTKLGLEYTPIDGSFDLNNLKNGNVRGTNFLNSPDDGRWFFVSSSSLSEGSNIIQEAIKLYDKSNKTYRRSKNNGVWGEWREQVGDKSVIDGLLAQKQDKLTAGEGITIQGNTISATGGSVPIEGASVSILGFGLPSDEIQGVVYGIGTREYALTTVVFNCFSATAEHVLDSGIKNMLEHYVLPNTSISNGALTITNDGTNMKLINSAGSQNVHQQGTFTFYSSTDGGGDTGGGGGAAK